MRSTDRMKGRARLIRHLLTLLTVILCKEFACAQSKNFKHFSYQQGLVQSPIDDFLQDDQGFIWFGNLKGLTRYDGYEFKSFAHNPADTSTISNNRINTVFLDSEKTIWIGTANGLNSFDRKLEVFHRFDIREIKGGRNYISCIAEDQDKNIWVGTFAGLKKLNKVTRMLEDLADEHSASLKESAIFSLFVDNENKLWVGAKNGLHKFDVAAGRTMSLPEALKSNDVLTSAKVIVVRQHSSGQLWFGTESAGVFSFAPSTNSLKTYLFSEKESNGLPSNWIKDILEVDNNTLWFATQNGISEFNMSTGVFTNHKHDPTDKNSLSDNAVRGLMKDRASCVWIGTFSSGIDFYYPGNSNFNNIGEGVVKNKGLLHPLVNAVSEDADGSLWIGTYGGGLTHMDRARIKTEHFSVKSPGDGRTIDCIKSIADNGKGGLWIGTLEGLSFFNKESRRMMHYQIPNKEAKLSGKLVNAMLPEGDGVWLATNGGGLKYFKNGSVTISQTRTEDALSLADNFVTALLDDTLGFMWVGTQNGLNYYNKTTNTFTKVFRRERGKSDVLTHNHVTTLFKDSNDQLWIGTEDGLNYLDKATESIYNLNQIVKLEDQVIRGITEDHEGNIWVSTDLGLAKLSIEQKQIPFKESDIVRTKFNASDGIASNQFSSHAAVRLSTDELAFGGLNGLSIFRPDKIMVNDDAPAVALTEILINNKQVSIGAGQPLTESSATIQQLNLNYDQGLISFKFSGLNYINPEKISYAYQLIGLPNAEQWQEIGNRRLVNFTNLLPGTYNFNIRASNGGGRNSTYIRSVKLVVMPPWWKTWWAYAIYSITGIGIIIAILALLEYRRKMQSDLYFEHLQNERQKEMYQMKLNFFTNISHEIRTPLTLILGPVEKLMDNSANKKSENRQLHLIRNNASRLMKLVTELMDFRKAEDGHMKIHCSLQDVVLFSQKIFEYFEALAAERNIKYEFVGPPEAIFIYFDANQLEKVIFNLLSNAFKFTPENGNITFRVESDPASSDWVRLTVADNGKGIPASYHEQLFKNFFQVDDSGRQSIGSGVGLALSRSIVELHHGKIDFTSNIASGEIAGNTSFTVALRKGKDHLHEDQIVSEGMNADAPGSLIPYLLPDDISAEQTSGHSRKKFTVLIAEDNTDVRSFLADTLRTSYDVLSFADGLDALQAMKHEIPDLIVTDIMMPGMDGLEFCKHVKTAESTNHIPVILLTARASDAHQVEGLQTGADAYISKPFNTRILELTIKNLLMSKELLREKFSQQLVVQPSDTPIDSPEQKFLLKLMAIIESRIENPEFDVNELVTEIGMSRSVLYKKVQTLTNYSVADLIKEMRLKKAAKLFRETSMSIADVAFAVGFNDRKYFSKEFRRQFNMSPSEFLSTVERQS